MLWYNVNSTGQANRSYSFNLGSTNNYLNRIDAPDSLALKGVWQHLVVTVNGDFQIIYLNGAEIVRTDFAGTGKPMLKETLLELVPGTIHQILDFSGLLDEVRIYNSTFQQNEVSTFMVRELRDLGIVPNFRRKLSIQTIISQLP